ALTSERVAEVTNAFLDVADDAEFRAKQMQASGVRLIQRASRSQSGGEFLDSKSKILKSTGWRFFLRRLLGSSHMDHVEQAGQLLPHEIKRAGRVVQGL